MRLTHRSSVDLPQPDGPMIAVTLPLGIGIETLNRACFGPYHSEKFSICQDGLLRRSTVLWMTASIGSPRAIASSRLIPLASAANAEALGLTDVRGWADWIDRCLIDCACWLS